MIIVHELPTYHYLPYHDGIHEIHLAVHHCAHLILIFPDFLLATHVHSTK